MGVMYLLYESASGYALFERVKSDEVSVQNEDVNDLKRFSNLVKFKAFVPFDSAESALENINAVSEGEATKTLTDFLEANIPKDSKITIGVLEPKLGNVLSEVCGYKVKCNDMTLELIRGIRLHFARFIKAMKDGDLQQAMLGLGHSYSRSKVKFNVHRVDNMIIQSSALLEGLDKDLNTFSMRVREWYSWHFPELVKIVNDNYLFAKLAVLIGDKSTLSEDKLPAIEAVVEDPDKAKQILDASRMSMGTDISPIDLLNIHNFAQRVVSLTEYRKNLHQYLSSKMNLVAPNLSALIGEQLGARLISHAGSLTSLAKYPASTVQILGAEKALFRALKTKGNTPKYGLIFHSSAIGRAGAKHKGRISRYLANKCSMASRIDSFTDPAAPGAGSNIYGTKLRQQVEERLEFYKTGAAPRKNIDVMQEAAKEEAALDDGAAPAEDEKKKKSKKDKKRKAEEEPAEEEAPVEAKKSKKEKKEKKEKKDKKKDKKEESD